MTAHWVALQNLNRQWSLFPFKVLFSLTICEIIYHFKVLSHQAVQVIFVSSVQLQTEDTSVTWTRRLKGVRFILAMDQFGLTSLYMFCSFSFSSAFMHADTFSTVRRQTSLFSPSVTILHKKPTIWSFIHRIYSLLINTALLKCVNIMWYELHILWTCL